MYETGPALQTGETTVPVVTTVWATVQPGSGAVGDWAVSEKAPLAGSILQSLAVIDENGVWIGGQCLGSANAY